MWEVTNAFRVPVRKPEVGDLEGLRGTLHDQSE